MNIRITTIISLFILFFAGISDVSAQDGKKTIWGDVLVVDPQNPTITTSFEYSNKVRIYIFLTKEYADEALEALRKNKGVITAENGNVPYRTDSKGHYQIENVPSDGYILFWSTDVVYGPDDHKVILPIYSNQEIDCDFKKQNRMIDEFVTTAEYTKVKIKSHSDNTEGPEGMLCSFRQKVYCRVSDYMRVLVQPILYDRSDVSNPEADTIYSYGHAIYHNMDEYDLTQLHRMDFDLSHDSINYYTRLQGDSVYYDGLMNDSVKSKDDKPHVLLNLTHDTIDVYVADRFRGYDPDASHPYPYGVNITVDDYNSEICSFSFRNNGERRNPLRFLDFSFTEFLPDKELFFEKQEFESIPNSGELKLNFGKAGNFVIAANDTASHAALAKLGEELYRAKNSGERESLHEVIVYGIASPEGNLKSNKELAKKRAAFAEGKVKSYVPGTRVTVETDVAGWDILADSLKKGGHEQIANAVYDIVKRYPLKGKNDAEGYRRQQNQIAKLPEYRDLILKEYLPKLRTVTYNYVIYRFGQLPTDTVIERYRKDPKKKFTRGEYWTLFENLDDKRELMEVARYALNVTRDTITADTVYSKGYWPYAAAVLACCYIACDTVDLELLKPFLDLEKDSSNSIKGKQINRSAINGKRIAGYINFPDMAANQLIMCLKNKGGYNVNDIAVLESIIESEIAKNPGIAEYKAYERLLAFSLCLRGLYKRTEERYVKARDLVASSSNHNFVVMALAMDDPSTSYDDPDWLYRANGVIDMLEKCDVTDYMNAVIKLRLEAAKSANRNFAEVDSLLAGCFANDIKYLLIAANDADLLVKQNNEHKVLPSVLTKWSNIMDEKNLDETHPYHWFKKAWDEVRAKSPDNGLIEERLNKCFSIDERYITVLNIYMRDNSKGMKKERLEMLRNIRDRYKLKN